MSNKFWTDEGLPFKEKKPFNITTCLILCLINLSFAIRFTLVFLGYSSRLDKSSTVILLAALLLSLGLAVMSLISPLIHRILGHFSQQRVVFELFIGFLFSNQILEWILKRQDPPIVIEIRSWFFALALWTTFCFIAFKVSSHFPELLPAQKKEGRSLFKGSNRLIYYGGLLVIVGCIAGYWIYSQLVNPLPVFIHYDPEYPYLLNALSPFQDGELYRRMGHPGTFMQLLGSSFHVLIDAVKFSTAGKELNLFITRPEYYLGLARFFLLAITVFAVLRLAAITVPLRDRADIFAALSVPLMYIVSHHGSLQYTTIWSPNSFNFAFGTLILAVLLVRIRREEEISTGEIKSIALAAGVVSTFQIYLLSWGVGISIAVFLDDLIREGKLLSALRRGALAAGAYLVGYFLGTLVIVSSYGGFLDWILRITIHQGIYGTGPSGILTGQLLLANLKNLVTTTPELFLILITLVVGAAVLLLRLRKSIKEQAGIWALILGLLIQITVQLLMIFKHPFERYLLSVAAVLPILFAALVSLMAKLPRVKAYLYPALFSLLTLGLVFTLAGGISSHNAELHQYQAYQIEVDDFLDRTAAAWNMDRGDLKLYWTYGSFSPCFSLWFGNEYAKSRFSDQISEYCDPQNSYAIDIWSRTILPANQENGEIDLKRGTIIIGDPPDLIVNGFEVYGKLYRSDIEGLGFILQD
jgi:hypothetical protein